jgi:hypothetical protein
MAAAAHYDIGVWPWLGNCCRCDVDLTVFVQASADAAQKTVWDLQRQLHLAKSQPSTRQQQMVVGRIENRLNSAQMQLAGYHGYAGNNSGNPPGVFGGRFNGVTCIKHRSCGQCWWRKNATGSRAAEPEFYARRKPTDSRRHAIVVKPLRNVPLRDLKAKFKQGERPCQGYMAAYISPNWAYDGHNVNPRVVSDGWKEKTLSCIGCYRRRPFCHPPPATIDLTFDSDSDVLPRLRF